MLSRKFVMLCLLSLLMLSTVTAPAQEDTVRVVPIMGSLFNVRLSPDGQTFVTFENGVIHEDTPIADYLPIWLHDVGSGEPKIFLTGFTDYATDVAFTPDGQKLASYHSNGYIYLWDAGTGQQLAQFPAFIGSGRIQFLADGKTLAVITGEGFYIFLWDTDTGSITRLLANRPASFQQWRDGASNRMAGPDRFVALGVSPDGSTLVTSSFYDIVLAWDIAAGDSRLLYRSEDDRPSASIRQFDFSADGSALAYYPRRDEVLHVVSATTGLEIYSLAQEVNAFTMAPDGDHLAWLGTGDNAATLYISSISQPDQVQVVELPLLEGMQARGPAIYLAFTPDVRTIIAGGFSALDTDENAVFVVTVGG